MGMIVSVILSANLSDALYTKITNILNGVPKLNIRGHPF